MSKWFTRRSRKKITKVISMCIMVCVISWIVVMFEINLNAAPTATKEEIPVNLKVPRKVLKPNFSPMKEEKPEQKKQPREKIPKPEKPSPKGLKVEDVAWIKPYLDDPVINPHDYEYKINPTHICQQDVFLIIYVHTHPANSARRTTIRETWANPENFPETPIRIIFVVGETPSNEAMQDMIQLESMEFEDIVQETFIDAYVNMTLKAVASLKWISKYCSHAKYILKTDDDAFINMYPLIKHLKELDASEVYRERVLMCRVWWKMDVYREGRWKVPEELIPDKYYPPYCSGIMYVMSMDVGLVLYRMSLSIKPFWVDDVYITGLIPQRVGIKHFDFIWAYVPMENMVDYYTPTNWYKYVFTHINNMTLLTQMWNNVQGYAKNSKIPDMKIINPGKIAENYTKLAYKHDPKKYAPKNDVVNAHKYKRLIEPSSGCDQDVFLAIYVHSTPEQAGRRRLVRMTWGQQGLVPDLKTKLLFVTGQKPSIKDIQQVLELEAEDYNDILQEEYEDEFKNIHLKSIGGLKWISEKCGKAKYVLKTDDNTFVNTFALLRHLRGLHAVDKYTHNLLMCNRLWDGMPVARVGQYRVLEENYGEKFFPPYCSGLAWVASADVAKKIVDTSAHLIPPFTIDDALITGYLVKFVAGVKHVDLRPTFVEPNDLNTKFDSDDWYKYLFSAVNKLIEGKKLWKKIIDRQKTSRLAKVTDIKPGKLFQS